jgi:hypothetical protein
MIKESDMDFVLEIERLIRETCSAIDSAYMSEEFLTSANESFDKIPSLRSLKTQMEKDGNPTDPS